MDPTALTAAQQELLPNDADIAVYDEQGYWISPVIIPADVLDAAQRGMDRFYLGDLDANWPSIPTDWTPGDGDGLRKNDYASLRVHELAQLVRYPLIAATAARLSGADTIRLWHDQLLYKPVSHAGASANVGWHTDRQYWLSCSSAEMLTAWVGFHDVDECGGSVSFLPGSHRWRVSGLDFFDQNLRQLEDDVRVQGHVFHKQPVAMRRGQVSFHHCRTVHGSGPNHSDHPRRSLAIHLQPGNNRRHALVLADGTLAAHANDQFVRRHDGIPDYADPRVCPTLWPPTTHFYYRTLEASQ
jgi:ectoine hydroxylase-related dioxygenase (phytanoyl-CoA dioxygenase family)